jgi:hypothetical protein
MCIICIKNQQNVRTSTDVFLLWYFHLYVLAGNMVYAIHTLHSAHKSKWLNTLENYCIQFFHECNIIGKEQAHKEKNPSIWIELQPTAVPHWHITAYCQPPPKQTSSG